MDWIISKDRLKTEQTPSAGGRFYFHSDQGQRLQTGNTEVIVEGYIIPRLEYSGQLKGLTGAHLVSVLLNKYGERFIGMIKGIFTLIIIEGDTFRLYNDTHGLSRFFIRKNKDSFIISNKIASLRAFSDAAPDFNNLALYCLSEHFVKEMTAFSDIKQSSSASYISYKGSLSETQYWKPQELLHVEYEKHEIDYYADWWAKLLNGYIEALGVKDATLTLTGGCDSRLVLAGLRSSGVHINAFSYGDPASLDVITAGNISDKLLLNYVNHSIGSPTSEWLTSTWLKLAGKGETLVNLHRAHRYQAAINEKSRNPHVKMLFTGLMGGEYLRGIEYDGYIISDFFRRLSSNTSSGSTREAAEILVQKGINTGVLDTEGLKDRLEYLCSDFRGQRKEKEFLLAFYLYGCAHHYQDSLIYRSQFDFVVNPFMDIDFMNMIASTDFASFRHPGGVYNWLWASQFQVRLTHLLLPELSVVPYNKKGLYTAKDLTGSKVRYIFKRGLALKRQKSYPPNFRYGSWMKNFVEEQISAISPAVAPLFQINEIKGNLQRITSDLSEKEWHYYTNPVNLSQIFK